MHTFSIVLDLATLSTCAELTSAHAKQAASSSTQLRTLLERFALIARPGEGCPKILMAVAHLVGQEWVEGPLRVELAGEGEATTMIIMCEYGVGIRERIVPLTRFEVPFDEFSRALELSPALALPLKITDEVGRIVLTPLLVPEDHLDAAPPTAFELDDKSLGEDLRKTAPPPAIPESLRDSVNEAPTRPIPRIAEKAD